jgi:hypothetical protein
MARSLFRIPALMPAQIVTRILTRTLTGKCGWQR